MQPHAVSCFVVLNIKGQPKKLLLNWEYRYPVGQYMLSVPAGLIDKGDWNNPNALVDTAIRELKEETGSKWRNPMRSKLFLHAYSVHRA